MNSLNQSIEKHYHKHELYEDIVKRLEEHGTDLNNVKRSDIAGVDEFHVRGAEVSKELSTYINLHGADVLDIGCGLGGPCRMLADEFGCTTTGIDLSAEYVRTANELSRLVKLEDRTTFIQGDATNLPFDSDSFEVVWSQHVQMNVQNKELFYSEVERVLKPGGHFLYYDIFQNKDGEVTYPMPWASTANQSFLIKVGELEQTLTRLGFSKTISTNQTLAGIGFFDDSVAKLKEFGPPKIGLNVLMGKTTKPKLMNLLAHLKKAILSLESGVYKK